MRPPFLNEKKKGTDHEGSPPESLKPLKYRRFRRSVPVKKHARSSLDGRRRISVPCPHDLRPDLYGAFFVEEKKRRLRQRTHKLGASKNMGIFFCEKIAPAATYPQARGFQKYGALFLW